VNANPNVDAGPRLPRQIAAQAQHAHDLLKAGQELPIPPTSVATAAPPPSVSTPPPAVFTVEQLLNPPDPEKDASRDYWNARANAVEGFRREDNARNKLRIERLESELGKLKEKNAELAKSHPAMQPVVDLKKHFTEEEIESIGEERATAILRASQQQADTLVQERIDAALKPLLESQKAKVEETEIDRHRKFIEGLNDGFPTWQVTDRDPRWLKWLDGVDETTGYTFQQIINKHKADMNAAGIVKMLKAFVLSLKPVEIPPEPPVTPSVMDGTGGDAPPTPNAGAGDGKILTQAEIKDGYKRKTLGKMTREEAQLFDARVAAQMAQAGRA
jgi:hypothetical protein